MYEHLILALVIAILLIYFFCTEHFASSGKRKWWKGGWGGRHWQTPTSEWSYNTGYPWWRFSTTAYPTYYYDYYKDSNNPYFICMDACRSAKNPFRCKLDCESNYRSEWYSPYLR